jgi:dimethylamine/trimethylamine dehydrogenase
MSNVEVFLESELTVEDILSFDFDQVVLATGAKWRSDGVGVTNWKPIPGSGQSHVHSVEQIIDGDPISGPVVVFDDDNFYMGAIIAEKLRRDGLEVTLITTATEVSAWTKHTLEQHRIQASILNLGIGVLTSKNIIKINKTEVDLACTYTDKVSSTAASSVVLVTSKQPNNDLSKALAIHQEKQGKSGDLSVISIGDCLNPSTIAAAVHDGHRAAREMDAPPENPDLPFKRERVLLE